MVFVHLIELHFPKTLTSISIDSRTNFIDQLPGLRNKYAHYTFKFIPQRGEKSITIKHITIVKGVIKEKQLEITIDKFEKDISGIWLLIEITRDVIIKKAKSKADTEFKIEKGLYENLPDYIKKNAPSFIMNLH